MNSPRIDIDRVHSAALRREIGERLRVYFQRELPPPPPRLRQLLKQLAQSDHALPERRTAGLRG
jgi:hypothetical protein